MTTEPEEKVLNVLPANIAEIARVCEVESTRYALQGVHVEIANGKYECAATDTRRLLIVSGECLERSPAPGRFIVEKTTTHKNKRVDDKPVKAVIAKKDLLRSPGLSEDQTKTLGFSQNCEAVSIAVDKRRTIEAPIMEGRFPDYKAVLPRKEPAVTLHLNARYLAEILAIAAKFQVSGRTAKNCIIDLEVRTAEDPIVIRLSEQSQGSQKFTAILMPLFPGANA